MRTFDSADKKHNKVECKRWYSIDNIMFRSMKTTWIVYGHCRHPALKLLLGPEI